ncbi:MAG: ATP-binding cassette domain-containing protein [Psychrobacillus sp.]
MIQIRNLNKTIKRKKVLNNIDIDIKGITGIIGPNGAGKTTLMKIIAKVIEGEKNTSINYNSQHSSEVKIGYLPQHFDIYPNLTVMNVLILLSQLKNQFNIEYIEELLTLLNLNEFRNIKMKKLSGGTLRRVGIAQALLNKPDYLIIDEPTVGLDILECINLRNSLLNISKKNINIIISSHIPEDITSICDYLVVINKGEKKFEGNIDALIAHSSDLVYETIVDKTNIKAVDNVGIILNVEHLSNERAKIRILSKYPIIDPAYKKVTPDFISGYITLLKGWN